MGPQRAKSGETWGQWHEVGPDMFNENNAPDIPVDRSPFITTPGQYDVSLEHFGETACVIDDVKLFYEGRPVLAEMLTTVRAGELYSINRTARIIEASLITLKMKLRTEKPKGLSAVVLIKSAIE